MIRQFFLTSLPVTFRRVFKMPWVQSLLVFLFFLTIFGYAQFAHEGLYGSDAYYHAKHSALVYESENMSVVKPWIAFHFFSTMPADPYFLHHFITGQFNRFFDAQSALKIVSAIQSALIFFFFYLIARSLVKKHSFLWALVFFLSSAIFSFRILLNRPFIASIAFMIVGFYFLTKRKYGWTFILSILYILTYNFIAPFLFLAFLFSASSYYEKKKLNLKPIIAVFGGVLIGLLLHPQTIGYSHVILVHTFEIFYLKLKGVPLPSGSELATLSFSAIMLGNIIVIALFLISSSLALHLHSEKKLDKHSFVLLLFSSATLLTTIFIPRMVEYWVPFTFLLAVYVFRQAQKENIFREMPHLSKRKKLILTTAFLAILTVLCTRNLVIFYQNVSHSNSEKKAELYEAASMLEKNVPKGETIFLTSWSSFAPLFYENSDFKYIAGFDPVFLYNYDKKLYWTWHNLVLRGVYCPQRDACVQSKPMHQIRSASPGIRNIFDSEYIFSSKTSPLSKDFINFTHHRPDDFEVLFENDGYIIFQVK